MNVGVPLAVWLGEAVALGVIDKVNVSVSVEVKVGVKVRVGE